MDQKHIFKSFLYFYKRLYNNPISYTETAQQLCATFIELLIKQYRTTDRLGDDFLWMYFIFQFEYWSQLEVKSFNGKINLSFIVGKKAFQRYLDREPEFDWQILENARTYSKTQFKEFVNLPKINIEAPIYDPDEIYRRGELNSSLGLSNCITYTSLYSPASKSCSQCLFIAKCQDVLKQIYPKIYNDRKIENGAKQTAAR